MENEIDTSAKYRCKSICITKRKGERCMIQLTEEYVKENGQYCSMHQRGAAPSSGRFIKKSKVVETDSETETEVESEPELTLFNKAEKVEKAEKKIEPIEPPKKTIPLTSHQILELYYEKRKEEHTATIISAHSNEIKDLKILYANRLKNLKDMYKNESMGLEDHFNQEIKSLHTKHENELGNIDWDQVFQHE